MTELGLPVARLPGGKLHCAPGSPATKVDRGQPALGLLKTTRLVTRDGCPQLNELAGSSPVEVWGGHDWTLVTVFPGDVSRACYQVTLSDGSVVACTRETRWPVSDAEASNREAAVGRTQYVPSREAAVGRTQYVLTEQVKPGLVLARPSVPQPFHQEQVSTARQMGENAGRRAAEGFNFTLPPPVFTMNTGSLREFAHGWWQAQKGSGLLGPVGALRDLKTVLSCSGFPGAFLVPRGPIATLEFAGLARGLVPDQPGRGDPFEPEPSMCGRFRMIPLRVQQVERLGRRGVYYVQPCTSGPVVANDVMLSC